MRRGSAAILCLVLLLAGCGASEDDRPQAAEAVPQGGTGAPIAGRTLSCQTGGPTSSLTFAANGTLTGRLLDSEVTGTWRVTETSEIDTHVKAGAISLRDTLRRTGNRWAGRTLTCTG